MMSTPRRRRAGRFRQTEIEDLDVPVGSDLDVGRLEVPVNDAAFVRRLQAPRQAVARSNDLVERQRTGGESFGQGRTLDELEHERGDACALLQAVDCPDVRMIQRGERSRLLLEAGESVGILREEVGQYLDRDGTPQLRVVARDRPRPFRRRRATTRFGTDPAGCRATIGLTVVGDANRGASPNDPALSCAPSSDSTAARNTGIMLAGRVEVRLSRRPLERRRGCEYPADVRPLAGIDVRALCQRLTSFHEINVLRWRPRTIKAGRSIGSSERRQPRELPAQLPAAEEREAYGVGAIE